MHSFSPAFRKGKEGAPRPFAVWCAVSDHLDSAINTWDYLNRMGKVPHLLWDPRDGLVIEGIPLDRLALMVPSVGIQIAVICDPKDPFTSYPMYCSDEVFKALKGVGVPGVWPNGPPASWGVPLSISEASLAPGHYSANQINPEWTGIGPIDVRRLHGSDA